MIVVHHLENSRSQRILWLLEEMGLPYEVRRYDRDPTTRLAPPALREVHPLGKAPVVVDGGQVLAETGAIVETLLERYPGAGLAPAPGAPARADYLYWMHFAEGSAMPPSVMKLVFSMTARQAPFFLKPFARLISQGVQDRLLDPILARQQTFMEAHLARTGWFAGDSFSAADIMMSFPVETMAARGDLSASPALGAWLKTIHARPAYRAALRKGGPYVYGP